MRSEKIDTRAVLLGTPGDANATDPSVRIRERKRILDYWPRDLLDPIESGSLEAPPWRLLLDPTDWGDVPREEVFEVVRAALALGRWPSLDNLRTRFGRVSNHRSPGEVEEQGSLL